MTTDDRIRAIAWFEKQAKCLAMPGAARMFGLAAEALNAGRWIPVGERLPKRNEDVLLVSDGAVTHGHLFYYQDGRRFFTAHAMEIPRVTHWRPLPEPPKMKQMWREW